MRALFFFWTDPCKKRNIAKAEPVAQSKYADIIKVLPDSDPTNKKSENQLQHLLQQVLLLQNKQRLAAVKVIAFGSDACVARATQTYQQTFLWRQTKMARTCKGLNSCCQ